MNTGKLYEAARVFGLNPNTYTIDDVTAAFRKESKTCHPDSEAHDPVKWQRIIWARVTLADWLRLRPEPRRLGVAAPLGSCRACNGSGRIKQSSGLKMFCVLCDGSGNRKVEEQEE